jgi:hypothetical protein
VLKVKWLYRETMTRPQYIMAAFHLTAWYNGSARYVEDVDFTDPIVFLRAKALVESADNIDLSDAFQVLSLREGYFSRMMGDSKTVLVTADVKLAKLARAEGLRVWSVTQEPPPS